MAELKVADFDRFVFVVGAPRSGTTTMSRMLQQHPEVAFPFVKEPHFFSLHDLRGLGRDALAERVERDYLNFFFDPPEPGRRVGAEGSVSYLYAPEQLAPILELWPDSRFVVGVRDPMTLLPSLHQRLIFVGDENLTRFEDAWAAIPDRAAGRRIPPSAIEPRWLRYDEAARYATYIERLFAAVGRERCLVMVHDDLVADPAAQHRRLLDFAGLAPVPLEGVGAERRGQGVRSPRLQRLLKRPPKMLMPLFAGIQHRRRFDREAELRPGDRAQQKILSLRKRLLRWNKVDARPAPVPLHVQREIQERLRGEVDRLGRLIGRDLGHWLQLRPSA